MIDVTVPNTERLEVDLNLTRARLLADLKREITRAAIDVQAEVKANKLTGQALNVRSGRLRRSINYRTKETSTGVEATVGTNVEYARVHEFGFRGTVSVKDHMRKSKNGMRSMVRSHLRRVDLPERSFLRSTLREMRGEIESRIAQAIGQAIAKGGIR